MDPQLKVGCFVLDILGSSGCCRVGLDSQMTSSFLSEDQETWRPGLLWKAVQHPHTLLDFGSLTPGRQIATSVENYLLLEIFLGYDFVNKSE